MTRPKNWPRALPNGRGIFLDRGIKSVAAIEAMKTMAYEIAEQLGYSLNDGARWRAPDWFIQGVSGGMGPIGVGKGFREMLDFGLVEKMPALGLIQSTGCAPMVEAFERGQRIATPVENPADDYRHTGDRESRSRLRTAL